MMVRPQELEAQGLLTLAGPLRCGSGVGERQEVLQNGMPPTPVPPTKVTPIKGKGGRGRASPAKHRRLSPKATACKQSH